MVIADYLIFTVYFILVLAVGVYFYRKNKDREDYYVGGRKMSPSHIGMSIVATDVGGGFSIGLGGLGFAMGLSGSWLLFTGLVGAWLAAVLIIPKIKKVDARLGMLTFPDFLRHKYDGRVALAAAIISGIGYLGFTSAQILAGAKLAAGSVFSDFSLGMDPLHFSLYIMAAIILLYTVLGGLKAVIYTDTIQWIILLSGLLLFGVPFAIIHAGGLNAMKAQLPAEFFTLTNIEPVQFINWFFTIVPIWFIAMTLYQRIYATRSVKEAKRAFYTAGLLEYPIMSFLGVFLGMSSRIFFPDVEAEMGLPMLLRDVLPIGITGIVIAAYFSAIMSTADSCLIASSGNFVNDIIEPYLLPKLKDKQLLRVSNLVTLIIGAGALIIASAFTTVLEIILHAYAFMVAGLLVPTLGAYFWKKSDALTALISMMTGGGVTLFLIFSDLSMPLGLDASIYGIAISAVIFFPVSYLRYQLKGKTMFDTIEKINQSTVQYGPNNDRVYLMKLHRSDYPEIIGRLHEIAEQNRYGKIFAKIPAWAEAHFKKEGYIEEARIPRFYNGETDALFQCKYLNKDGRNRPDDEQQQIIDHNLELARQKHSDEAKNVAFSSDHFEVRPLRDEDMEELSGVYTSVFKTYPFPIHDVDYLRETMQDHIVYFGAFKDGKLAAASSCELDEAGSNVEMTDFATLPEYRGHGLATKLLHKMEKAMQERGIKTAYTIARALSAGMNITFAKMGYQFGGTLVNNTNISGKIESMNVWYKSLANG